MNDESRQIIMDLLDETRCEIDNLKGRIEEIVGKIEGIRRQVADFERRVKRFQQKMEDLKDGSKINSTQVTNQQLPKQH